jgi:hypothetical protein
MVRRHGSPSPASCESPIGVFDAPVTCEQPPEFEGATVHIPDPIVKVVEADIFSDADVCDVDPLMGCHRMPPLALTSRTSKRSGSSSGGGVLGIFLEEGASQAAGVCMSSASCGRWPLNSSRKRSNVRC